MNRIFAVSILICLFLSGCKTETKHQTEATQPQKHIWVFAQFNVPEENDKIDSYWYYGRMPESLYLEIAANRKQQGFVALTQVHYWGNDDAVHPYEDEEYEGEMLFRIEDLRKVTRVKRLPGIPEQHDRDLEKIEAEDA